MNDEKTLRPEAEESEQSAEPEVHAEPGSQESEQSSEIKRLSDEIAALRARLESTENGHTHEIQSERLASELSELSRFFPDVTPDEIPESVWQKVREGGSLAGSFALWRYSEEREKKRIGERNDANRRMSAGSVAGHASPSYYSPDEVKKMTRSQVREHYDDVIESMRHWQ